jgi:hypothetical protein
MWTTMGWERGERRAAPRRRPPAAAARSARGARRRAAHICSGLASLSAMKYARRA